MNLVTHLNLSGANGQDDPEAPQQQITTQSGAHCSHSFLTVWILVRVLTGSQSESDYDSQSPISGDCFFLFIFFWLVLLLSFWFGFVYSVLFVFLLIIF